MITFSINRTENGDRFELTSATQCPQGMSFNVLLTAPYMPGVDNGPVVAAMVRVAGELLAADAKVDKQVAQAELYMGKLKDMLHSSFSMGGGQVAVGESVVPLPHETCPECQAVKTIGKPCQVCEMLKGPGAC